MVAVNEKREGRSLVILGNGLLSGLQKNFRVTPRRASREQNKGVDDESRLNDKQ